ncbi:MAG: MoaD/ThiS family protein [Bacteroidota bacterium]
MQLQILAFGIARDIVGNSKISFQLEKGQTVKDLKAALVKQFPDFQQLVSLSIAVNTEYAMDDHLLKESDEIVIIPPVAGG